MVTFQVGLQEEARVRPEPNPDSHLEHRSRLSVGLVIAATSWLATTSVPTSPVLPTSQSGGLVQADSDNTLDRPELGPDRLLKPALPTPVLLDGLALVSAYPSFDPEHDRRLLDAPKQGPPTRR